MKIDGTSVTLSRQKNELYQFCIANSYAILYKSLFEKCYYQFARKITINLCAKISHFMRKATATPHCTPSGQFFVFIYRYPFPPFFGCRFPFSGSVYLSASTHSSSRISSARADFSRGMEGADLRPITSSGKYGTCRNPASMFGKNLSLW